MSTLVDIVSKAYCASGHIVVLMESGLEIRFPTNRNERLSAGTEEQLNNIEISPCGLHWPDLDEDLSMKGLLEGNYGQSA